MLKLLSKELKLTINPFFYILPVIMGLLMLIPNWLYMLVFLYFCFITAPNVLSGCKAQNDLGFSILLPVRKDDIVLARILSFSLVELIHVATGAVFAAVNIGLYGRAGLFMTPDIAFFGLVFIMFGLFNLFLFPIFYKTAYKYGAATIVSNVAAVLFALAMEMLYIFNPSFRGLMTDYRWFVLAGGIIFFILMNYIAYKISAVSFRRVDA